MYPGEKGVRGEFGWVRFLVVCFPIHNQSQPTKKYFVVGKSGPNATFHLFFLGLGWPCPGLGSSPVSSYL